MENQVQALKVLHNITTDEAIDVNGILEPWENIRKL
jgi:hypothetical protein